MALADLVDHYIIWGQEIWGLPTPQFRTMMGCRNSCNLVAVAILLSFSLVHSFTSTSFHVSVNVAPARSITARLPSVEASSQVSFQDVMSSSNEEAWTSPRLHNTAAFRSFAILAVLSAVGVATPITQSLPQQALAFTHLFSFASWLGTVNYTTFVLGITMFKNLPRQTFGKLQAKLFPKYFGLSSIALVLQLVTTKVLSVAHKPSLVALGVALGTNLLNQFIVEPLSTDNMLQRYEMEAKGKTDSEAYKKLKASFGKFHGMSSLLNLVTLCAGTTHGYYLATALLQ